MEYTSQQFQAGQVLRASQLNAMDAALKTSMKSARPVEVYLDKTYSNSETVGIGRGRHITIRAVGLTPNTNYAIQLFRWSNSRKAWVSMYSDEKNDETFGWYFLKGSIMRGETNRPLNYFTDEIPTWMTNNGKLKSRWLFTTNTTNYTNYTKYIKVASWIVDAFKPAGDANEGHWSTGQCALIGIPQKKHRALKFKAGILQKMPNGSFELVGMSDSTLNIYAPGIIYESYCERPEPGIVSTKISY